MPYTYHVSSLKGLDCGQVSSTVFSEKGLVFFIDPRVGLITEMLEL